MNRSEQFVYKLSKAACLSLWTYPNPIGKSGKELCDVLVVCQPDVVIFSVKEIELKIEGDTTLQAERWKRRAVEASVDQVYGAERRLTAINEVTASDGRVGVAVGPLSERRLHRVAVAIGSRGHVPLESRDFGKGFVHVLDEATIALLLSELDTITDFVEYLSARQALLMNTGLSGVLISSDEDLLAVYLTGTHSFGSLLQGDYHLRIIDGAWEGLSMDPRYLAKKNADEDSYVWDSLIGLVHEDYANDNMESGGDLASVDSVTRVMARESRLQRRGIGKAFKDFMADETIASRYVMSDSGVTYVFLKQAHSEPRERRVAELQARCFVARDTIDTMGRRGLVAGIATELPENGSGSSLDCLLLDVPDWTDTFRARAKWFREEAGFFKKPRTTHVHGDEFPIA